MQDVYMYVIKFLVIFQSSVAKFLNSDFSTIYFFRETTEIL